MFNAKLEPENNMNNNYISRGYNKSRKIANYALNKSKGKFIDVYNNISDSKKFKFSIIIAVYNTEEYLSESIESIINQTIGFNSIELILVDDGSTDNSKEICLTYQKQYPNNIKYVFQENQGQAAARNNGMEIANGKYLNFLDSDDKLESNALELVYDFFAEYYHLVDVVSIPLRFFDREEGEHILNYKYNKTRLVDLTRDPNYIQLSASSAFFKKDAIKNEKFNTELVISEDALFLNKILLEKNTLGVIADTAYLYRKRNEKGSTIDSSIQNKDYYIHRSKAYFKELFDYSKSKYGKTPDFIKYTVMYEIQWMFAIGNINEILNENEINWLYDFLYTILQEIDDEIILNQKHEDSSLLKTILIFKHDVKIKTQKDSEKVLKKVNERIIDQLHYHVFYFDNIEIVNNELCVLGFLRSFFNDDELKIQAVKYDESSFNKIWEEHINKNKELFFDENHIDKLDSYYDLNTIKNLKNESFFKLDSYNEEYNKIFNEFTSKNAEIIPIKELHYPKRDRTYLNLSYDGFLNFECSIPLQSIETSSIKFQVKYDDLTYNLKTAINYYSKLTSESYYSKKGDFLIKYEEDNFKITNYSDEKLLNLERENIRYLELKGEPKLDEVIEFRKNYLNNYLKYKDRKIWLFIDRPDMADDNAEHLFKYAINQDDGIEKYFVIKKESKDFERLRKIGPVIEYQSKEHMLLGCFAQNVISSHPDDEIINPFFGDFEKYYNGLFSSKLCFLQHGITLNNVSEWLRKYDKFLSLIVTASKKEHQSFFDNPYNYDESVVQLLGFPRFDNLKKGCEKNQILIMPTWRRFFIHHSKQEIKNSNYIKKINSLLNNDKLIKFSKKNNFKIIFKPHPNLYEYIDLIKADDYIKIDYDSSYQKLLKESKLFITDYSSITFDFAYMKKPVIYYQYENDEFHFNLDESYFDFDEMGFGKIANDENTLVDLIKKHIDNNCIMDDKFQSRVDEFYEFNDTDNCKRVYEFILNMDNP